MVWNPSCSGPRQGSVSGGHIAPCREGKGMPAQLFSLPPSPLHSCVTGLVDNDCLPSLVNIMVHAKVGSYPVQQHPMVRGHLRELLKLVAEKRGESIRI